LPVSSIQSPTIFNDTFGGGAGGVRQNTTGTYVPGGPGVVRIVWPGNIRQFPSTNVGNF
jgi:hypothetical protein